MRPESFIYYGDFKTSLSDTFSNLLAPNDFDIWVHFVTIQRPVSTCVFLFKCDFYLNIPVFITGVSLISVLNLKHAVCGSLRLAMCLLHKTIKA